MPYVKDSSSSGASDSESVPQLLYNGQRIVSDWEYAGGSNATRNEPPLSEQLEPIAVIGMGMRIFDDNFEDGSADF